MVRVLNPILELHRSAVDTFLCGLVYSSYLDYAVRVFRLPGAADVVYTYPWAIDLLSYTAKCDKAHLNKCPSFVKR